ncbi:hypothetical protein [Oryza sativa Japonica Group]|uniref:Uncharacterized protein P0436D06.8 n=1 Tax=Oryza sativa subsp. japonica TaxID=39947 RepID=Q5QN98_ORYSJ|nr:hypothetical protein [Oryza sativa Japonica Group]
MAEALLLAREELYKWGLARAKGILALFSIAHRNEYLRGLVDCSPSKSLTFSEVGVLDAEAQRS